MAVRRGPTEPATQQVDDSHGDEPGGAPRRRVTVVFVPGLGLDGASVRPTRRWLRSPSVVRPLPGFGLPARAGRALTPVEAAGRLLADLRTDGFLAVVLVGHSSSCQIVAEAARMDPTLVRGLLLVGPTTDVRSRTWPRLAARWLRTAAHERPGEVPTLLRQYSRTGLASMRRTMDLARRHDLRPALSRAACPVVIVRGAADRIAPADWIDELAEITSGRAVTLPSGGHMIVLTHGGPVADLLDELTTESARASVAPVREAGLR